LERLRVLTGKNPNESRIGAHSPPPELFDLCDLNFDLCFFHGVGPALFGLLFYVDPPRLNVFQLSELDPYPLTEAVEVVFRHMV
jgi:hypothetical protein